MVSLVAIINWRIPSLVVLFFFLVFAALDGAYMSSALRKVPEGAWFTLVLAIVLSSIFILWRWGKEQQWAAESEDRITPAQFLQLSRTPPTSVSHGQNQERPKLTLSPAFGGGNISTASGLGIFFDKVGGGGNAIPKVLVQFIRKFKARPDVVVFFHMRPLSQPSVPPAQRFVITRVPQIPSAYRLTLRHGYMDDVLTPDLGRIITHELTLFITRGGTTDNSLAPTDHPPAVREEMAALNLAQEAQVVYVMGKQVMRIRRGGDGNIIRRAARRLGLEAFLWIRENSRTKLADLDIDYDNLIEVGFVKEI